MPTKVLERKNAEGIKVGVTRAGQNCRELSSQTALSVRPAGGHAVCPVDRGNMEEIMRKVGTQVRSVSKIKRFWFSTVRSCNFQFHESEISPSNKQLVYDQAPRRELTLVEGRDLQQN